MATWFHRRIIRRK
jgi:hypothetical protein